ncbi:hypothetical protein PENSUB_12882 [Penicillium subrubescens]|uniref:Uncharacterized protein n=1 Tax=Penicillium subrubescens TaxID=1316194 RepID=A0A1Q5SWJ5_9EURO|nr:hypothetical protein PENSUB_12882 [Penicillium subrubescens]
MCVYWTVLEAGLRALGLILAAYALGIQAAPTGEHEKVSILDLVRNGTVVEESGTVTYQNSLPEPNKDDPYEVDGIKLYRHPGGIDVHPVYGEKRNITFHNGAK